MAAAKYPMIEMDDALALVLAHSAPLAAVEVPLPRPREHVDALTRLGAATNEDASPSSLLGKVLARDVVAHEPQPPFAASIMDGYAVIADDTATASPGGEAADDGCVLRVVCDALIAPYPHRRYTDTGFC